MPVFSPLYLAGVLLLDTLHTSAQRSAFLPPKFIRFSDHPYPISAIIRLARQRRSFHPFVRCFDRGERLEISTVVGSNRGDNAALCTEW